MYTGFTIESLHLEPCVVSKTVLIVVFNDVRRLLTCILLQCSSSLRDILMTANLSQRNDFKLLSKDVLYLLELMFIIRCKYYFHLYKTFLEY